MKDVKLFFSQFCPYCQGVKEFIVDNNLKVELVDATTDKANKESLLDIGGKIQVPMLSIDGEALYESADIMKWLQENADSLK